MSNMARKGWLNALFMLIAGVLYPLSFSPFEFWPLSIVSLGFLFYCWSWQSKKQSALSGFIFGLGMFGVGISWMYVSISTFGGMPPIIAGLCIFILVALLSIFIALTGFLQACLALSVTSRLLMGMPILWISMEWLRGWIFTGLPWLLAGYAYIDTPLAGYASFGGVYLVGYLAVVCIALLLCVGLLRRFVLLLPVIAIYAIGAGLLTVNFTYSTGEATKVAIIQNNVSLGMKWDARRAQAIVQDYLQTSQHISDVDLIVWPEAAVPFYADQLERTFWQQLQTHEADFMFGVLYRAKVGQDQPYYNAVAAVKDNDTIAFYKKQHLVPFGEYFPLQWLLKPLIDMLHIPVSDFSSWQRAQAPLEVADGRFAVSICYEDAFPQVWSEQVKSAGALFNVSEDIWFGDSLAPHQRLQMARFRALETQKPMIRSANNGLSSLIGANGRVEKVAPQFTRDIVRGDVMLHAGITPYVEYGNFPIITAMLFGLIAMFFKGLLFAKRPLKTKG